MGVDQKLIAHCGFYDLVAEIQQRYRDLALQNEALVSECGNLHQLVEGLLGVYGKYVDEAEIARWRAMAAIGAVPR